MRRIVLVALVVALAALAAVARDNPLSRPLTEERLQKLLPVLKAEADLLAKDAAALHDAALAAWPEQPSRDPKTDLGAAPFALKKELKRAGLCAEDYLDAKIALALARDDARLAAGPAIAPKATPDASEQQGKELDAVYATSEIRRQNSDLFRKHAAELGPLLQRLAL
jgi:hypothetical protein